MRACDPGGSGGMPRSAIHDDAVRLDMIAIAEIAAELLAPAEHLRATPAIGDVLPEARVLMMAPPALASGAR